MNVKIDIIVTSSVEHGCIKMILW